MGRRGRSVADAEADVARLEQAAAQWRSEAATKRGELAQLEATRGDQVLAGVDARRLHAAAEDLRILIAGADAAADSADRQLRSARAEVPRAKAAELQVQATAAHRAADAHQAKVDALLAQLREMDGVDYAWRVPEPDGIRAVGPGSRVGMTYDIPKTDVLHDAARALDEEVAALEARAVAIEQGAVGALI